ncbi:(2Fe-2S)-binding protein [Bacillus sp. J14TS2]|uniref:(2Fe-2S)-binding protein n=1 Tax=Bacillus sp. J14TS2 TaxID=2807188 RepID=UPI001BB43BD1|nr:(2Fe-2S)-binding protein [Bacillus sp. J14TS2]
MLENNSFIICRCEEVSYQKLSETMAAFHCSPRELKLRTRAGMGYCGGRVCRTLIDEIAHSMNPRQDEITLKYQPPIRPVSFGELGGVNNDKQNT